MKSILSNITQGTALRGFDLFRLSKSKEAVDVCSNTLREFHRQGLNFYRCGKAVFVSKTELDSFIRTRATANGVNWPTEPKSRRSVIP